MLQLQPDYQLTDYKKCQPNNIYCSYWTENWRVYDKDKDLLNYWYSREIVGSDVHLLALVLPRGSLCFSFFAFWWLHPGGSVRLPGSSFHSYLICSTVTWGQWLGRTLSLIVLVSRCLMRYHGDANQAFVFLQKKSRPVAAEVAGSNAYRILGWMWFIVSVTPLLWAEGVIEYDCKSPTKTIFGGYGKDCVIEVYRLRAASHPSWYL